MTQPPGSGAAFAPAHITGFFVICPHENPAMAGSLGCGITLEAGITTRVEIGGSAGPDDSPCPTIGSVVSRLDPAPVFGSHHIGHPDRRRVRGKWCRRARHGICTQSTHYRSI